MRIHEGLPHVSMSPPVAWFEVHPAYLVVIVVGTSFRERIWDRTQDWRPF